VLHFLVTCYEEQLNQAAVSALFYYRFLLNMFWMFLLEPLWLCLLFYVLLRYVSWLLWFGCQYSAELLASKTPLMKPVICRGDYHNRDHVGERVIFILSCVCCQCASEWHI